MEPDGKHINDPRVDYFKVQKYILEFKGMTFPEVKPNATHIVDIDGEPFKSETICAEIVCGLATMFCSPFK